MRNIYEKALQVMKQEDIDHHETDLYLKVNEISTALINEYDFKINVETFISNIEPHCLWYCVYWAYSPGWKKENRWPYNSPLPNFKNGGEQNV